MLDRGFDVIDLVGLQPRSSDLGELHAMLQQLVGQPFLFFKVSHGDELAAHFGRTHEYDNPRMRSLRKGSFIVGVRASVWSLRPSALPGLLLAGRDGAIAYPPNRARRLAAQAVESETFVRPGSIIIGAKCFPAGGGFGLEVTLSDESVLLVLPAAREDAAGSEEIADWEVFAPHDRYLRVGPGNQWSYLDSSQKSSSS